MLRLTMERVVHPKDSDPKVSFDTYRHAHFLLRFYELYKRRAHAIGTISGVRDSSDGSEDGAVGLAFHQGELH